MQKKDRNQRQFERVNKIDEQTTIECPECGSDVVPQWVSNTAGSGNWIHYSTHTSQYRRCPICGKVIEFESNDSGDDCFIATCVFESKDAPEVVRLRTFRDATLSRYWTGQMFIRCYYAIGPKIAIYIEPHDFLKVPIRFVLKSLTKLLR